ncbi:MAG: hypothetical protein ACTSUP_00405 [Candidatus Heimdallarchaeaceae archaeon]
MPCQRIDDGFVCSNKVVKCDGFIIELPPTGHPVPLKKDGTPYKRIPKRFWKLLEGKGYVASLLTS